MRDAAANLATGLMSGALLGALLAPVAAAEMKPEEAKRFIAGKLFSYSCFDGTKGAGRIQADGSVVGTMQVNSGRMRFVSLPPGTIKLTSDSICASLPHALIQPCFNVVQTSATSFRGSLRAFSFAYCDFQRHNSRMDLARNEEETTGSVPRARAASHPAPVPHVIAAPVAEVVTAPLPPPAAASQPGEPGDVALRPSHY